MTRVTVVVPCYNEARRLDVESFRRFVDFAPDLGFLFVNDGSTDETAAIIDALARERPASFRALHLESNSGKAEAVRAGMLAALDGECAYAGYWDADLATPLATLPLLITVLDERPDIDLVMGSRVQLLGRRIERELSRHYLGRVFATVASLVLGLRVYDTQCGAKVFRATEEARSLFAEPFRSRWVFDVELLARLVRTRRDSDRLAIERAVYELPLLEWRDVEGSKLRGGDFARAAADLVAIWWRHLRGSPPRTRERMRPRDRPAAEPLPAPSASRSAGAPESMSPAASAHRTPDT